MLSTAPGAGVSKRALRGHIPPMPKTESASAAPRPGDHVFLVDGSGFVYRAYHALPPLTRKSDGLPTGAVAGFCNMLWKLLQDASAGVKPTHLAVVFDKSEHTFRNEMYDEYKAHRPEAPDDLKPQFGLIRKAVAAFNVAGVEQLGFEADDIIATYARLGIEAGADVTIVSSDKDLMQLVRPGVTMYDTMKDRRIGTEEVIEKFGVPPDKVIEVQALIGDSVDNVPGVPGIGVKTAAQLITEFGSLEALLDAADTIKQPKRREALIQNADKARLSKKLVTLDGNVPLEVPIENLAVRERDGPLLVGFCKAMEFTALTRRVGEATGTDIEAIEPAIPGDAPTKKAAKKDRASVTEEAVPARPVYRPYFNAGDKRRRSVGGDILLGARQARRRSDDRGRLAALRRKSLRDGHQPRSPRRMAGGGPCARPARDRRRDELARSHAGRDRRRQPRDGAGEGGLRSAGAHERRGRSPWRWPGRGADRGEGRAPAAQAGS